MQSRAKRSQSNTLFTALKKDHRLVAEILTRMENTSERAVKKREKLFQEFSDEMTRHSEAEERILYPRLKEESDTEEIGFESIEEHRVVKYLMSEIESTHPESKEWLAKVMVLKEVVEHHVEEEEGEMFKKMQKAFSKDELEELGQTFLRAKEGEERYIDTEEAAESDMGRVA